MNVFLTSVVCFVTYRIYYCGVGLIMNFSTGVAHGFGAQ